MPWTVRVKVKEGLYHLTSQQQWQEEDLETPEQVAEKVLQVLKEQNPALVVVVRIK